VSFYILYQFWIYQYPQNIENSHLSVFSGYSLDIDSHWLLILIRYILKKKKLTDKLSVSFYILYQFWMYQYPQNIKNSHLSVFSGYSLDIDSHWLLILIRYIFKKKKRVFYHTQCTIRSAVIVFWILVQ